MLEKFWAVLSILFYPINFWQIIKAEKRFCDKPTIPSALSNESEYIGENNIRSSC
jgi:hypothetical protein